jgi:HSP20 family protein
MILILVRGSIMTYHSTLDNFFSSQRPMFSLSKRVWNPPSDIYETEAAAVIKIEVSGLDDAGMQIVADRNRLIVRGHRAMPAMCDKTNYHLMEIHYGHFERIFAFSFQLDQDAIKATYEKGFIIIEVQKQPLRVTSVKVDVIQDPERP